MSQAVVTGAMLRCSFGMAPAPFNVLPTARVFVCGRPVAAMMDNVPLAGIPPFGMCSCPANPAVAAATAAALGVLTPMPCMPVCPAPWAPPKPNVLIGGKPAIDAGAKLMCAYGGVIQIVSPGQVQVTL